MSNRKENDDVSVLLWMVMLFVTFIPIIGTVMIIVWAFYGNNQTRKNYFRAIILWILLPIIIWTILIALGVVTVSSSVMIQRILNYLSAL